MRNVAVKKRYVNGGVQLSFFVQEGDIKPGEYCLILVEEAAKFDKMQQLLEQANQALRSCYSVIDREGLETNWPAIKNMVNAVLGDQHRFLHPDDDTANDKDARIATLETKLKNAETYGSAMADDNRELRKQLKAGDRAYLENERLLHLAIERLEKQLAERSPGVMPECVEQALAAGVWDGKEALAAVARAVKYYAPPAGHRWEPVDDANPITAEDAGRMFCWGPTRIEHVFGNGPKFQAAIEGRYILRPVAQPFVFTGEPALYEVKMDSGAEIRCDVYQTRKGPVLDWYNGAIISLNSDGTFPGGRIVGRAVE